MNVLEYKIKGMDDSPIKMSVLNIQEHPWHYHKQLEILYLLKGSLEVESSIYKINLKPDHFFIMNYNVPHHIKASEDNVTLSLQINADYFTEYIPNLKEMIFICDQENESKQEKYYPVIKKTLSSIFTNYFNLTSDTDQDMIDDCIVLLATLTNHFNYWSLNNSDIVVNNPYKNKPLQLDRLLRLVRYMYKNYSNKLTLDELAESEHISKYYASHIISEGIGLPFQSYLNLIRVEFAQILLYGTSLPISEISEQCGFSSATFFRKIYEHHSGYTPSADRKRVAGHTIDAMPIMDTNLLTELSPETIAALLKADYPNETHHGFDNAEKNIESIKIDLSSSNHVSNDIYCKEFALSSPLQLISWKSIEAIQTLVYSSGFDMLSVDLELLKESFNAFSSWNIFEDFLEVMTSLKLKMKIVYTEPDETLNRFMEFAKKRNFFNIVLSEKNTPEPHNGITSPAMMIDGIINKDASVPFLYRTNDDSPYLFEHNNLKTPTYYVYWTLNRLGVNQLFKSDNVYVSRSKKGIQILLYNPISESGHNSKKHYIFNITNIQKNYICHVHKISNVTGDEYSLFSNLGKPEYLDQITKEMIAKKTFPHIDLFGIESTPEYNLHLSSDPDTITLIELY